MAFRFRLESVRRYRRRIVDDKGRAVALARQEAARCRTRRDEIEAELRREMEAPTGKRLRVSDLLAKTRWLEHLRSRLKACDQELAAAETRLAGALSELNAAWRDLEVLNQLRKRQKAAWLEELSRRERRDLDEIGQIRAEARRRQERLPQQA